MKYPRASGTLRQAPDPTLKRACFARTTMLRTLSNLGLSRSGAPKSNPGSAPETVNNNIIFVMFACTVEHILIKKKEACDLQRIH